MSETRKIGKRRKKTSLTEKDYHMQWINGFLPERLGQPVNKKVAEDNIPKLYTIFDGLLKDLPVSHSPKLVYADNPRQARLIYDLLLEQWEKDGKDDNGSYLAMCDVIHDVVASGRKPKKESTENMMSAFMGIQDYDWFGSYQKWIEENDPIEAFDLLTLLSEANIFNCILCTHVCIITRMPERLTINNEFQLDCPDMKPTMIWSSETETWKYAWWRNTQIDPTWIETPEVLTKEVIMGLENAELKRIAVEIIGAEKFAEMLDIEKIDEHTEVTMEPVFDLNDIRKNVPSDIKDEDIKKMAQMLGPDGKDTMLEYIYGVDRKFKQFKEVTKNYELYRTKGIFDPVVNDKAVFLKVICPSTDRVYYLGIPPNITSSKEALAWVEPEAVQDKDQYIMLGET